MLDYWFAVVLAAASLSLLLLLRSSRSTLYRALEGRRGEFAAAFAGGGVADLANSELPDFSRRLARINQALTPERFAEIRNEIEALVDTERSYLPTHKKGGTVAYETLCEKAPRTVGLYQSPEMSRLVSRLVGETLEPTPINDQSSCSVLFYERPGDHIGWHYDHNFYRGRHVTVLIPIVNRGHGPNGLSSARLEARFGKDEVAMIDTSPNSLVVFEGQKVLHRVTPIADGERRIILSMTFATDPRASTLQGLKRRIKDVAFFGPRALWT